MTTRRLITVLLLATVAVCAASTAAVAARPTAHLLVYAQEWSLWPSRSTLPAGRVAVELWNRGQDPHDVRIRRLGAHGMMVGATQGVATTGPGAVAHATWTLRRGVYELYCSMPGHMQLGMHARLTVR
jgi:hypothetical protein